MCQFFWYQQRIQKKQSSFCTFRSSFCFYCFFSFLHLLRLSQHFTSKFSIPLDVRAGRRASLSVAETLPLMTQRTSWVRKQAYWNAMRCIDVWHHCTTGTTMYLYFVVSSIDVGQCVHLKVRWEWAKSIWKIWICFLALRRAALRQPSLVAKVADFPQPGEARDLNELNTRMSRKLDVPAGVFFALAVGPRLVN